MEQAAEPSGTEPNGNGPTVEELQDFYLNAQSRSLLARDNLAEMVETQRSQAEAVVTMITTLREQLRASEAARMSLEEENRRQATRVANLDQQLKHVHGQFARLSEGYSAIMHVVENTHASSLGLHQRIDAMLLQNDLGVAGRAPPPPVRRVAEFRENVFPPQQRPLYAEQAQHDYRPHDPHAGDGQFSTYGTEGYAARPLHPLRNER